MDLTQLARAVVDGLRLVGVPVCLAAVLVLAAMALTPRSRRRLLLTGRGSQTRPGPSWRLWTAGILLPMQFVLPVPSGAAIILIAGSCFLLCALIRALRGGA